MASSDIRDIMDMGAPGEARPTKKQKLSAAKKNDQYAGMSKEVRGLMMGDGVPPVQVQENRYKTKPKIAKRSQPWIRESFTNPARADGLVLSHWVRGGNSARPETPGGTGAPVTPADSKTENDGESSKPIAPAIQTNYYFSKFNTKPGGPEYTDEEYEQHLKSDSWSKEETDYLVQLAMEFDLRWVVVWDRYDFQPKETTGDGDSMAVTIAPKQRSMEELKHRYYQVSAKVMTLHHPLSTMSTLEFDLHEKMMKFDPAREATRKRLAEALLARSPDELREEEVLLGELKRIVDNEDRFLEERKELYQRLDHPQSHGSISVYESSAGLISLMQNLLANDKNKKRRSLMGPEATNSPAQSAPSQTPTSAHPGHRSSVGGTSSNKKGAHTQGVQTRQLSQRDEIRFGVTHSERPGSGVVFRQSRVEKLVLAKSAAQQQKLHDALGQLGIPVRAVMPTLRVCAEYEKLIGSVHTLLDARKTSEKLSNEIKVLTTQREMRERKEKGEDDGDNAEQKDDSSKMDLDGNNDEDDKAEPKDSFDEEDRNREDSDKENDDDEEEEEEEEVEADEDDEDNAEEENDEGDLEEDNDDVEVEEEDDDGEEAGGTQEIDEDEDKMEDHDLNDVAEDHELEADPDEEDLVPSIKLTSANKRSASVLSQSSDKSAKRTRK